jgi:hypothetical protein
MALVCKQTIPTEQHYYYNNKQHSNWFNSTDTYKNIVGVAANEL